MPCHASKLPLHAVVLHDVIHDLAGGVAAPDSGADEEVTPTRGVREK
jgi:hypothetical protein